MGDFVQVDPKHIVLLRHLRNDLNPQVNESSQLLRQLSTPELPPPHLAAWQGKPDMLRDILQVLINVFLITILIKTGSPPNCCGH